MGRLLIALTLGGVTVNLNMVCDSMILAGAVPPAHDDAFISES